MCACVSSLYKFNINIILLIYCLYHSDNMGPQVLFCPTSFTKRATAQTAIVKWDKPIFKDNRLGFIEPECNRQSGDSFHWGDWNIYCRAYDHNQNNEPAMCHFVVTVRRKWLIGCLRAKDISHQILQNPILKSYESVYPHHV